MMSGLMLVFLLISIGFMIEIESKKEKMKKVAQEYKDNKVNLNEVLFDRFENNLEEWGAEIEDNIIIFNGSEVLFSTNETKISKKFQNVLDEFCPKLIDILIQSSFINQIKEIRIEGHTSNDWGKSTSRDEVYLKNMKLSQERAYSVLFYCYKIKDIRIQNNIQWVEKHLRANGMGFSKLKDFNNSKRVEFSIELHTEDKIYKILE